MSDAPDERTRAVLAGMGAPESLAGPLIGALGPQAAEELAEDPWRLLALPSITPDQADYCARRALGDAASPDDPRRGRALVGRLLSAAVREGSTAVEERELGRALRSMRIADPGPSIEAALDDGAVMAFEVFPEDAEDDFTGGEAPEMPDPDRFFAPARIGLAEQDLGEGIARLVGTSEPIMDPATAAETVEAAAERLGAGIPAETAAAAVASIMRGVTVLQHGAASAEALRQVLACLAEAAADSRVGLAVASPTAQTAAYVNAVLGDALRVGAAVEEPAGEGEEAEEKGAAEEPGGEAPEGAPAPEHPSAEDGDGDGPGDPVAAAAADLAALGERAPGAVAQEAAAADGAGRDGAGQLGDAQAGDGAEAAPAVASASVPLGRLLEAGVPIPAGIVAVTDAMALDVERAAALVEACEDGTHLVLFADPAEAPSARPGQVVPDLVRSRLAAVAELPADPSAGPLGALAAAVAGGELAQVDAPGREVVVVPAGSGAEAAHRAVQLVGDSIPRALGISAEHVQIVAATRGGEAGADALNRACKERFNPGPGALRGLDPGDRVLLGGDGPGYSAGDIGYLRASGEDGGRPEVELSGGAVVPVDPAHLRPGWAVTVAAAHGSRWPAAVAVFGPETRGSRPQVYTALTRATRHLSIVHAAGPDLARAVAERASLPRTTRLVDVIREG
ncbi:helix-hairpin-helix domain-containing protein [Nocardiopsis potens]|uniref:helix-hairpin-helix domain-containing protein n=1 Tax=Nocardiopsis potens TaxID=1246458 RepID=UPI00034618C9|nr:helix-hairpin-helix domain-containing protein [Nocardiopsis potens]